MKTPISCLSLALFLLPASAFSQGSLTPPGPPAPTMHTLDQLGTKTDQANATLNQIDTKTDQASAKLDQIDARSERRTPISSLPFTISSAGSYYLTNNLTATANGGGITVSANNVTIDLNGFALTGGGGGSAAGINVPAPITGLSVRNGAVSGWTNGGISADRVTGSSFEKLLLANNTGPPSAAGLNAGSGSHIQGCVAIKQASIGGIQTDAGCSVADSSASFNGGPGFALGGSNTIANCASNENSGVGIAAERGTTVLHCSAKSNVGVGIAASFFCTLADCAAVANDSGITVDSGSVVRGNTASDNNNNGISCTHGCHVVDNNCYANNHLVVATNAGIFISGSTNRIEANSCISNRNGLGISVPTGKDNLIIKNSASGNTGGNYNMGSGNAFGPVINVSAGGPISDSNPWNNWIH
ncbi:MAG: right-handed parallel beta-helix repeat-containing protein [Chthoniobacterales bacterium]